MLENVLLLVDCRANFSGPTFGVIMDSYLHPRFNSIINKVFLQGGILKEGDFLFSGGKVGQIKTVSGEKKERLKTAVPGEVVLITGFGHTMELGERFIVINQNEFQELFREIELRKTRFRNSVIPDFFSTEKKTINLFLLADTENSLQTMIDLVQKKEYIDVFFNVVGLAVSQLFQSDLELALITKSVLLSFNVDVGSFVTTYVKENKLVLFGSHIIYEISKFLDAVVEEQKNKEKVISEVKKGEAKIKVVYSFSKGNIAGCWVNDGVIDRSGKVYLIRDNKKIYTGKIKSLEIERTSVKEAKAGQECGIVLNKFDDYRVGDIIVVYQLVESTKVT